MRKPWYQLDRSIGFIIISLVILIGVSICLWPVKKDVTLFSQAQNLPMTKKEASSPSELEVALEEASMPNKTLIVTMLNKAYAEEADGLLTVFLQSFREGGNTEHLIKHILFLTVDRVAFNLCSDLNLHCYKIGMNGGDFSEEVLYMTNSFIDLMWARTRLLGEMLRLGYSFIFTDMDILWLRNPFTNLKHKEEEDMLLSCDGYNGLPYDDRNSINTGFFFISSNNKTVSFLQKWYAARNNSEGMKEQDVLNSLKSEGEFRKMGIRVRYLDLEHFSGMCQTKYDAKKVTTVHANCCRTMKAKILDLKAMLETWRTINGTSEVVWPRHKACHDSWKVSNPEDEELEKALKFLSDENKTVIITIINKSHANKEGLLDLFLRGLRGGIGTDYLIDRILFVAVDQVALRRCTEMRLNCYELQMNGRDLSQEVVYEEEGFVQNNMWMRIYFLRTVLKHGYSFIFTDIDVLWLRNPLKNLIRNGEDMSISNSINTGFFFVVSNNKTITFFNKCYEAKNNSRGIKEMLNYMKNQGGFSKLNMKVRYLDTVRFCGLCQKKKCNVKKVVTVHANCCGTMQAKISDLTAVIEAWSRSDGWSSATWPKHKTCLDSSKIPDELEKTLQTTSMENKTLIITVLNKTYAEEGGLLDLFLRSLKEGEGTAQLIERLLLVATDAASFHRCRELRLHCHRLKEAEGGDHVHVEESYIARMRFLGEVLRRGYSFIFTDVDMIWLRNPFLKLNHTGEDLMISRNWLNTGFFFVSSNNKTISLFDKDVLNNMKSEGFFEKMGVKFRFLDRVHFSGLCEASYDFKEVTTVHADCCETVKAKLVDLKLVFETFRGFDGTFRPWPKHNACRESLGF